ncbi:MAG: hemopexin repeat-containing protein, partial [Gammaproteobacteria bacterium]|nr:hemopexin repeat-containing protein [Gammaproteobacteria bacterium]
EDDTLLFVKGKEFLQFNSNSGDWSAPQLLNKLWSGLHLHDQVFNKLEAAFQGADDTMYFFGDGCYISHNNGQASAETEVNKHWGIVANPLQAKVDAAFVHNGTTYLFSGSSYVRYSGHNYAVVDEGYPKSITSDLRLESGFEHLPDAFEVHASVLDVNSDSVIIQAATSNQGNIYLYMGTCCYVSRRALTRTYPISILGQQRNQFANDGQIDAAFTSAAGKTYLFAKDQFIRYSKANYKWVDEGYPKRIVTSLANELNLKNLPWQFNSGIDAALQDAHGTTYLFKDGNYFSSRVGSTLGSIQQDWGKSKNNFEATNTIDLIDGALLDSSGQLYIFRGDQYLRYDDTTQPMAQPGYPRNIDSLFECPATFASGIDAAFNFAGDSYLVKGGSCIRYSGDHYSCHSKFFPARFSDRWGGWVDYQLSDLQKITRFKQLNEDFVGEIRLVDILSNTGNDITKPYEALSDIFAWDKDEVKWLKRNHAFLADNMLGESQFNIELINRMFVVFASTQKLGSDVKTVYTTLWQKLYSQSANLNDAANALYGLLASGELTGAEWQASIDGLHNQLNELKRDALVSYITTTDQYSDAKDLYENLLIDVSMEGCATTSRVKEAISAIQLYFHRYLVNLENLNQDPSTKQDIKQW